MDRTNSIGEFGGQNRRKPCNRDFELSPNGNQAESVPYQCFKFGDFKRLRNTDRLLGRNEHLCQKPYVRFVGLVLRRDCLITMYNYK